MMYIINESIWSQTSYNNLQAYNAIVVIYFIKPNQENTWSIKTDEGVLTNDKMEIANTFAKLYIIN